jgi:hypothetical protein
MDTTQPDDADPLMKLIEVYLHGVIPSDVKRQFLISDGYFDEICPPSGTRY